MKELKQIWTLNYDIIDMPEYGVDRIVKSLPNLPRELQCEAVDRVMVYCNKLSDISKNTLKNIVGNLQHCSCCINCCKKAFLQHSLELLDIVDFRFENPEKCIDEQKVGVIIPDYLSANSFLQPPIDMLNMIKLFKMHGINNRVKHLSFLQIGNMIKDCKYVLLTTTPYDHIQNYFVDYRLKSCFLLVNYIKTRFPDKTVILCGAHGTVRPDLVEKECLCDVIIRGEYDFAAPKYISALENKTTYNEGNIYYCRQECDVNYNDYSLYRQDDINIIPDYSEINLRDYYGDIYVNNTLKKVPYYATILASRGCYNHCNYCYNFWGNNVRYRDVTNIVDEMELLEHEGAKGVFFIDSTFTQNRVWTSMICQEIRRRKLQITWSAETRTDCVDQELLKEMKAANCTSLWFGVETYCDHVLKVNNKNNISSKSLETLEICRKIGIQPQQFIMIGAPGETKESINQTLSLLMNAKSTYTESVMITTPRFGTRLYELAKQQYPKLGSDFYSLNGVKGLVGNDLSPDILHLVKRMTQNRQLNII